MQTTTPVSNVSTASVVCNFIQLFVLDTIFSKIILCFFMILLKILYTIFPLYRMLDKMLQPNSLKFAIFLPLLPLMLCTGLKSKAIWRKCKTKFKLLRFTLPLHVTQNCSYFAENEEPPPLNVTIYWCTREIFLLLWLKF